MPPLSGWNNSTLPATKRCLIASKAAIRVEEASISDITARSMEDRASSTSALAPSSWANSCNLKSSTVKRKNGELGGSNASNIFDDKLFTPRAPIPWYGVYNFECAECPSGGSREGMVNLLASLALSRKG